MVQRQATHQLVEEQEEDHPRIPTHSGLHAAPILGDCSIHLCYEVQASKEA